MVFLDFEKDLESLHEQLEKIRQIGEKGDLDVTAMISELEQRIVDTRADIYDNLSGWQRVQLSRHPERPYTLFYIKQIATDFIELHGDRCFGDDKALVGGVGQIDGQTVVFIGQQKGVNTKLRQYRNFGMSNPEGYRKALRLMKLAERFGFPVVSLIDTPGAFPGIEAEARGQAEAIARNLFEMAQLRTPIVSVVIGEGASGGAIGIGLSDRTFMMENTWYSVISPESCSSILWRSWDQKERAAEELHLTATDMLGFGIIDGVIPEPVGGAHAEPVAAAAALKARIKSALDELGKLDYDELVRQRIDKYDNIGVYREGDTVQYHSATPLTPEAEYAALHPATTPRPRIAVTPSQIASPETAVPATAAAPATLMDERDLLAAGDIRNVSTGLEVLDPLGSSAGAELDLPSDPDLLATSSALTAHQAAANGHFENVDVVLGSGTVGFGESPLPASLEPRPISELQPQKARTLDMLKVKTVKPATPQSSPPITGIDAKPKAKSTSRRSKSL